MSIKNKILKNGEKGNRNGTKILEQLNGLCGFSVKNDNPDKDDPDKNYYNQSYSFKISYK
jgi:hypothetical protein